MNSRAFISNSTAVNSRIAETDRTPFNRMKLLGLDYDPVTNKFSLDMTFTLEPHTKGTSCVSIIYL